MKFADHGIAAEVAESRGVVTLRDTRGRNLVIACSNDNGPRGWILVTDIDTGETKQVFFPDGVANAPPYASLLSRNGRFYTGAGKVLLEYEPATEQWLSREIPQADAHCFVGEALADGPGGLIFGGTCYNSHLFSFDPATRRTVDYGRMDPEEKYFWYLAFDEAGWAYCGIGTARSNIVAFHPVSGERRQLVPEAERQLGTARVYRGVDGQVYGNAGERWYRLSNGTAEPIEVGAAADKAATGEIGWGQKTGLFPDGRRIRDYNLPGRRMEMEDPAKDGVKRMALDYRAGGAAVTTLTAGPGGNVYGSTCHPMHFFIFDTARQQLQDQGPHKEIGGGNICSMDVQGHYLVCPAYSKGWFYLYDTTKPWNGGFIEPANPRLLARYPEDIARPRAALAHPDGRHVAMAGYAGYGICGGGLAIHDLETGGDELIRHGQLVPNQSVIALKALADGNLVGGSTIEARGGGHATEKEGQLVLIDWPSRKVVFRIAPVPGAEGVVSLEVGSDGLVYGVTAPNPQLFVFDPATRRVVHRTSLAAYGDPVRPALLRGPSVGMIGLFTNAVIQIEPDSFRHTKLATPPVPITAGGAVQGTRLFYAAGSHLWSLDFEGPADGDRETP